MRRPVSTLLVLLVFLILTGILEVYAAADGSGVLAESGSGGEFQYRLRPDGTAEITAYLGGRETFLKTPAELDGFPVTAIGAGAFKNNKNLITVSVQEGIKEIGESAFSQCWNLTSVYLPEGLTTIGGFAFTGCSQLERVVIPDTVQNIGLFVFSFNSDVTVHVGEGSAAERYCQENNISYTYLSTDEESDWELRGMVQKAQIYLVMLGPMLLAGLLIRNNDLRIGVMSTSLGLTFLLVFFMIAQDGLKDGNEFGVIFLFLSVAAIGWGLHCFKEGIIERAGST